MDIIELGPEEEAVRIWNGAKAAFERAGADVAALFESLDLGLRAVEILVVHRLQPVKAAFPATIGLLLDLPAPEIDVERDAIQVPRALQFTDVLDLLSEPELACVGPGLHRGWEDRRFACRRSRETARDAVGISLNDPQRKDLLLLAAYRNRFFRTPPPIRVVQKDILSAYPSLVDLVERLTAR